jgi:acyl-CoA reductase-like NAD-dependent aldehyde dehydrogenase
VVQAAKAAVSAAFYNQGELCTSGSRLLVDRAIEEEVLAVLTKGTQAMVMGDPLSADTQIGPLVSAEHRDRVRGYVALGSEEGATLAVGGQALGPGYFVRPAVFTGVRPEARLAQEEVFGPVLSVIPFDGVDEAVRIANSTAFGLAAGVWTRDLGTAHRMIGALRAGTVWVNTYNRFDAASPYGGVGQSGFGRENGAAVLDEVTTRKTVWIAVPE